MIYSNLKMLPGSSREETKSVVLRLEKSLLDAVATMGYQPDVLKMSLGIVGANIGNNKQGSNSTDVLGGVVVELISSDKRKFKSDELINEWRNQTGSLEGVDNLTFVGQRSGPPGGDLDIRIAGASEIETRELKNIAIQVTDLIKRYPGISNVDDDLPFKPVVFDKNKFNIISLGSACCMIHNIHDNIYNDLGPLFRQPDNATNFFDWLITDFKFITYLFENLMIKDDNFLCLNNFTFQDVTASPQQLQGGWSNVYRKVEFKDKDIGSMISLHDVKKENIEIPDIAKRINPINISFIPIYNFLSKILL